MKNLKIQFDYSHGPIWKDVFNANTGEWSTGIDIVDKDRALNVLNDEAEREYSSLYSFDSEGVLHFDSQGFEDKKVHLLSLVQTIVLRLNSLNDGTYTIIDEGTPMLIH